MARAARTLAGRVVRLAMTRSYASLCCSDMPLKKALSDDHLR
jgi:hypothetical protein